MLLVNPKEIPDNFEIKGLVKEIITEFPSISTPVNNPNIEVYEIPEEVPVPFDAVEKVPVYLGCEDLSINNERPFDTGVEVAQGLKANVFHAELQTSYQ